MSTTAAMSCCGNSVPLDRFGALGHYPHQHSAGDHGRGHAYGREEVDPLAKQGINASL